uniref:Asparagine--tRNA ligase N-terminal domain-containing protein n=1 Tax=Sus scrofa TaxID=9823 RepID=A0A8D1ZL70_PIG
MVLAELYVSDREGSDATGDGTKEKPFKTGLKALMTAGKEPFPTIYVDSQKENERWDVISKSQMKNIRKMWHREQMKSESREKKEAEDNLRREKNLGTSMCHGCGPEKQLKKKKKSQVVILFMDALEEQGHVGGLNFQHLTLVVSLSKL